MIDSIDGGGGGGTAVVDAPAIDTAVDTSTSETVDTGLTGATETAADGQEGATQDGEQAPVVTQVNEPDEEEFPSDPSEPLTVRSLNEKIAKNPALAAIVNADPQLKNLFYSTARQAAKAAEFKSIFATADTAKTALSLAQKQMEFNGALEKGGESVLEHLYFNSVQRNPDGSMKIGPNGQYVTDGKYESVVKSYRTIAYDTIIKSGHPKAAEAVAVFAEIMGDKAPQGVVQGGTVTQDTTQELSPEVQERLRKADLYEQQVQQRSVEEAKQFHSDLSSEADSTVMGDIAKVISTINSGGNVALTPYVEEMLKERVLKDIHELAKNDQAYQQHIKFLLSNSGRTPEAKQKIVAAARAYAKEKLMQVTRKHLAEFSKPVMKKVTEKDRKVTDQLNQPNVSSAGGASTPSRPGITEQINEFIKSNKRKPTDRELLDFD